MHTRKRLTIAYLAMAAALLVLFALNLFWGSVALSPADVVSALLGRGQDVLTSNILLQLRLPRAVMVVLITKIRPARPLLVLGNVEGVVDQLRHTFVFRRHNGNHWDSQEFLHFIDMDRTAVAPDLVHHVQSQNHRHIQLY